MGELLLVRHGETEWSRNHWHTGRTDVPLTERGAEQARALRPLLARRRIARVLTSPLRRAAHTAELAGLTGAEPEPRLMEWDYGGYEKLTTPEIQRTRPGWDLWADGVVPGDAEHPGETLRDVAARTEAVIADVDPLLRGGDGDVVLVAHGHVLRVLAARRLGLDPAAGAVLRLDTATLSSLGTEHDRPVITGWNLPPDGA
ncbi:histidine phosphatase family protein [Nocardiopsis trehalosi]|uniref:histidine phosphatase family protein n=1 Tax=Nocardiopsis trehalosi TaxID=109329 RepID=UPI0008376402|nr:histidine phosphatase family protein [Nocardiopsis trehalosi]